MLQRRFDVMDRSDLEGILRANHLEIDEDAPITEGQSAYVLLGARTVVRVPKSLEASARLRQTAAVTSAIAPYLPVAISRPEIWDARGVPGGFLSIEPRLPGVALTRHAFVTLPESGQRRLLAAFREFLDALHELPLSVVEQARVPVVDAIEPWRSMMTRAEKLLESRLDPVDVRTVADRFQRFLDDVPQWNRSVRHGDFGASNLMVDHDALTGVVDFENLAVGDAAYDFASLSTLGPDVNARLADELDPPTLRRVEFYRFTFALQDALLAEESDDIETLEEAVGAYRGISIRPR
jgi:aminoglycoside 2''-phosphotransferase